jgi:AcrR family transcriptional regulator
MSPDGDRVRRRLPAGTRRALILDAARAVIAERGLSGATVREIADAAGVRPGTITHHFATTEELLAAVLHAESDRFRGEAAAAITGPSSAMQGLLAIGDVLLADRPEVRDHWRIWLDFLARAAHDVPLAESQSERYRDWRRLLRDLIAEGIARGELRAVDPDAAAVDLVALVDGLAIQAFFVLGDVTPEGARRHLADAVAHRFSPQAPAG